MTKNADYTQIAPRYNDARPLQRKDTAYWVDLVSDMIPSKVEGRVMLLDLGCGNGRFSITFAQQLNYDVIGVDSSDAMIREAKNNDTAHAVKWSVEDATRLVFPDDSFDVVWVSHLLHLVDNPQEVVRECFRVLKPGGILVDRYSSLEDNLMKPERKLFPELATLDKSIIPTQQQVEEWLQEAHFKSLETRHLKVPTFDTGDERYERAKHRAESGLTKISDAAFNAGLDGFKDYVKDHSYDTWILNETYTVTTALK